MNGRLATVFGGTGFLGGRIVRDLVQDGWAVRVASRHPRAPEGVPPSAEIELHKVDLQADMPVAYAVRDASAVVNAVSLYREQGDATFRAIHEEGAERVARRSRELGIERLVHVSGIGSDPDSSSAYVAARGRGEERVRQAYPDATLVRPSVMFGPRDAFLQGLDRVTRLPVVPMFGDGGARLQPVYVEDVASAVNRILDDPATARRIFELGGCAVYTYREALQAVMQHRGRRRPLMPVPFFLWYRLARLTARMAHPPLTQDQITLLEADNIVGPDAATFADLGIQPASLEERLGDCLPPA